MDEPLADGQPGEIIATPLSEPESGWIQPFQPRSCPGESQTTMEFLNFILILLAAWMVWRRPEKEKLAFRLLVASAIIMALLFLIGTHGSLVPGVNL